MKKIDSKPNYLSVFWFFVSYIRQNRIAFIYMFLFSIIFTFIIGISFFSYKIGNKLSPLIILLLIWTIETITISTQNFLTMLFDFKQTTIYRRIALTRITPFRFMLAASYFNLIINLIANTLIFITFVVWMHFSKITTMGSIFNYQLLIIIVFNLSIIILISSIIFILTVTINNRSTLNVISFFLTFFLSSFLVALSVVTFELPHINSAFQGWPTVLIIISELIVLLGFSGLFYFLSNRLFQWNE